MDEHQTKRLRFLFSTAYKVAKKDRKLFSDLSTSVNFGLKIGLDLGENYFKDHAYQKIVFSAATAIRDDVKLKHCGQEPFC